MKEELTEKEELVLRELKKIIKNDGIAPSVQELALACKYDSKSTIVSYLKKLEDKGYIKRRKKIARAIQVIDN